METRASNPCCICGLPGVDYNVVTDEIAYDLQFDAMVPVGVKVVLCTKHALVFLSQILQQDNMGVSWHVLRKLKEQTED